MKSIIILIFIVGLVMVVSGFYKQNLKCPKPQIVYRYVPKTFEEEQENPPSVLKMFSGLFNDPSAWQTQKMGLEKRDKNLKNYINKRKMLDKAIESRLKDEEVAEEAARIRENRRNVQTARRRTTQATRRRENRRTTQATRRSAINIRAPDIPNLDNIPSPRRFQPRVNLNRVT